MSDPAKSAREIEDVLASIRRLVSEHQPGPDGTMRPATGAAEPAPEPAPPHPDVPEVDPAAQDRLVLTPALRVLDPDDPWLPVPQRDAETGPETGPETGAEAEVDNATPQPAAPLWSPEDRLADFEDAEDAAETAGDTDARADGAPAATPALDAAAAPAPADLHRLIADEVEAAVAGLMQDEGLASAEFEPETGDLDWPGDGADRALRDLAAARGAMPAEAPAPDSVPVEMPDESFVPIFSRRFVTEAEEADDPDDADTDIAGYTDPGPDADTLPGRGARPTPLAETAEEEPLPLRASPPPDPAPVATDAPGKAMPGIDAGGLSADWTDAADIPDDEDTDMSDTPATALGTGRPAPAADAVEDLGDSPSPFTFPEDAGLLDESTLREIIAEVVREELQGALGQRITRNVRKMVRREIRMVLAADDLD